jgi:hypothetical protein
MADPTPEVPKPEAEQKPAKPKAPEYSLKFDPIGEFTETELYLRNRVTGKLWISERMSITLRSLTGREGDSIHEAIKVTQEMTSMHYQTEVTYRNLAYALVKIGDAEFSGTHEEKLNKVRDMSSMVLLKMSIAYAEFSDHVGELFAGKEGIVEAAKKS